MQGALLRVGALTVTLCVGTFAHGHRVSAGDLVLDHPYAIPTRAGAIHGAAYLRGIRNKGHRAERLLGASTSVAERVELRQGEHPGSDLPGRELASIELPAGQTTLLRHGGNYHLALIQLKRPLVAGDRFDLTLNFEHSGSQTVKVWVQTPRDSAKAVHQH
jgi:copper(I)-binding protein